MLVYAEKISCRSEEVGGKTVPSSLCDGWQSLRFETEFIKTLVTRSVIESLMKVTQEKRKFTLATTEQCPGNSLHHPIVLWHMHFSPEILCRFYNPV